MIKWNHLLFFVLVIFLTGLLVACEQSKQKESADEPDLAMIARANRDAADTSNIDEIQAIYQLTGEGVRVGQWESGLPLLNHEQFLHNGKKPSRILHQESGSIGDHATHVAGTMIGDGHGNMMAAGMAPNSMLMSFTNSNRSDTAEVERYGNIFAVSNHSYGIVNGWYFNPIPECLDGLPVWGGSIYEHGKYDYYAYYYDKVLYYNSDHLIVKSVGNERNAPCPTSGEDYHEIGSGCENIEYTEQHSCNPDYGMINGASNSKNILTVGAIEDILDDPINPLTIIPADFSNWGPTYDGRVKPDIVANGVGLLSSIASGIFNHYDSADGTSMATPTVTGGAALLYELFRKQNYRDPRAAEMKAIIIHTAIDAYSNDDCDGLNPGPDYQTGWGLFDSRAAADFIANDVREAPVPDTKRPRIRNDVFAGTELVYTLEKAPTEDFRVTMVWTDPPGVPAPSGPVSQIESLIHDLNVYIQPPNGDPILPWKLNPSLVDCPEHEPAPAPAERGVNNVDNVEVIDVDYDPAYGAGDWTIHITMTQSSWDGANQEFTLISDYGISPAQHPIMGVRRQLEFAGSPDINPASQSFHVQNIGTGDLTWEAAKGENATWFSLDKTSGTVPAGGYDEVWVTLNVSGMEEGFHSGLITLSSNDPGRKRHLAINLMLRRDEASNCDDQFDNDMDGFTDCQDNDCRGNSACPYFDAETCNDGYDNENDGLIDCNDPECIGHSSCKEQDFCNDDQDNDGNGYIDCADILSCDQSQQCLTYLSFSDVKDTVWYYPHIRELSARGIVKGCRENEFCPGENVRRSEFLKMAVYAAQRARQALDDWKAFTDDMETFENGQKQPFMDVDCETDWFCEPVLLACKNGVIDCTEDDEYFRPDDFLNRAEASKILSLALKLPSQTAGAPPFSDVPLGEWYTDYIYTMKTIGIIGGYPEGDFRPGNTINRAEAAKMVWKSYQYALRRKEVQ